MEHVSVTCERWCWSVSGCVCCIFGCSSLQKKKTTQHNTVSFPKETVAGIWLFWRTWNVRQLEMTHKLRIVFAFPMPTSIVFTACVCLCGRFSPSNMLLALCCPHFTEVAHVELWIKDSGEITLNVNWCRFFSLGVLETFLKHPTQFHVSVLSCISLSLSPHLMFSRPRLVSDFITFGISTI